MRRWAELDVGPTALAAVTLVAGQFEVWSGLRLGGIGSLPAHASSPLLAVLAVFSTVPLVAVRRFPVPVVLIVAGTLILQVSSVVPALSLVAGLLPLLIATFGSAAYAEPQLSGLGLLAAAAVQLSATHWIVEERAPGEIIFGAVILTGGWSLGAVVGRHLRRADRVVAAASWQVAEHRREAARLAAEERLRIARELHDVVAHGVSVMGVQAAAARVLLDQDVAAAASALRLVEQQARESIAELQRMLGVLRGADARDGGIGDGMTTDGRFADGEVLVTPGLDGLPNLIGTMRQAGLDIQMAVDGRPAALPSGLDLTAYRVVQEALTNSLKHAGPVAVQVRLQWDPDQLSIDVCDAGSNRTAPTAGVGHGLPGMAERVQLYGGRFQAAPRSPNGFAIRVELPLPSPAS